uniref:uncharacterized protein LOC120341532 n=1 Tax=Styela clava TaxID=7725 RepID=UPI0019398D67|nr:uncharacterized protein LOC120341532 [Styela clava]
MAPLDDLANSTSAIYASTEINEAQHHPGKITIGQMMFYTTAVLIVLVLLYASMVICKRTFTAKKVKKLATTIGKSTPLKNFIQNPMTVHVIDNRSDLEWDMEGFHVDNDSSKHHQLYLHPDCSNPT